jgi:hypothetical protein
MENLLYVKRGYNTIEHYVGYAVLVIPYKGTEVKYIIDREDAERIEQHKWYYHSNNTCSSSTTGLGVIHNFIMNVTGNSNVIHKDGNEFNCRKNNLEISNNSQPSVSAPVVEVESERNYKNIVETVNGYVVFFNGLEGKEFVGVYDTKEEAIGILQAKTEEALKALQNKIAGNLD